MERRKFLIGTGALASGSAAAVGTGAFTSVSAQRSVNIAVTSDNNSYLGLRATGDRAEFNGDELQLDFADSDNGASGLNPNSRTAFTDLFTIENQGDNPVLIAVGTSEDGVYADGSGDGHLFDNSGISGFVYNEESGGGTGLGPSGGFGSIQIDSGGRVDLDINDGQLNNDGTPSEGSLAAQRTLGPGESLEVDLSIETTSDPTINESNNRITILAAEPGSDRSDGGNGT
ncbi:hypothetical protein ACOJIV_27970 [Haloarcula sp. AONF1]